MAGNTFVGPVDYLVFAFPEHASVGDGLEAVLRRVDEGIVEILDLVCFTIDIDRTVVQLALADLQAESAFDLSVFDGARSGLIDADDREAIASELEPGQVALVVVYEDRSLAEASARWANAGGVELFVGGVDIDALASIVEEEN